MGYNGDPLEAYQAAPGRWGRVYSVGLVFGSGKERSSKLGSCEREGWLTSPAREPPSMLARPPFHQALHSKLLLEILA
jgi:hypothetical protein